MDSYLTLSGQSTGIYKEKGSKFIAYAIHCTDKESAKTAITHFRKENPTASHVCFAWRFGDNPAYYSDRASDDGEPSNSAGKPIHGQIVSFNLTNVLVAVVRIYGGTKLGVGGLINAYRTAAKTALENGKSIKKYACETLEIIFPYSEIGTIMNLLKRNDVNDIRNGFEGNSGKIIFEIRKSKTQNLIEVLENMHTLTIKKLTND